MATWNFRSITNALFGKRGITRNSSTASNFQYLIDKPSWLSLSSPNHYRKAVSENPVLNGCISILAQAAANGRKYLVDLKGNEISWDSKKPAVISAKKIFVDRPNPLQSPFEFNYERYYYLATFGNNYVFMNNPSSLTTDVLTVQTMMNLNSEFVEVKQTGKLFDQIDITGIIEKYLLTEYEPPKDFESRNVIHFNELNTSGIGAPIMGTSRLQSISLPIENTQLAFEAMNVILKSRGMQGIIKASTKDDVGTQSPLVGPLKDEIDKKFKDGYGILDNQKQFLIVNADIEYIKTIMNADELGIYNEFSNNAMIISNALGIPPELYKTYTQGATFENQIQAVRRLYQDRVIPMVENDDKIFSDRLMLSKYGLELKTSFEHIAALQESFKEEAQALQMNTNAAEKSYNNNLITWNQYLNLIGFEEVSNGDVYKFERDLTTNPKLDGTQEIDEKRIRRIS
jgi:phage portal protein BeeE